VDKVSPIFMIFGAIGIVAAIGVGLLDAKKGCALVFISLLILIGAAAVWSGMNMFITGDSLRRIWG